MGTKVGKCFSKLRKLLLFKINEVRDLQIFVFNITVLVLFLAILSYITRYLYDYINTTI